MALERHGEENQVSALSGLAVVGAADRPLTGDPCIELFGAAMARSSEREPRMTWCPPLANR
jgi:hypothetical protein